MPARRPLFVYWIVDSSGSMGAGGRMQEVNFALREVLPDLRRVAAENSAVEVKVRTVRFATGADWQSDAAEPIEEFEWSDLRAGGYTDLGAALSLVAAELGVPPMPERAAPPLLVLLSDGRPTDDFEHGLESLGASAWGPQAIRVAVAIGDDADLDVLQRFTGRSGARVLRAGSVVSLASQIRWVSTTVAAGVARAAGTSAVAPPPPQPVLVDIERTDVPDVW